MHSDIMQAVMIEIVEDGRRVSSVDLRLLPLKLTLSPMEDISVLIISSERCISSKLVRHTLFLQLLAPRP